MRALSEGMANAAQWSLVAATAFLALGFVGALRVRRAAGEKGARYLVSVPDNGDSRWSRYGLPAL